MKKYKVLHAPVIALYQVGNLVEISKNRGWKAESVVWNLIGCEGLHHHNPENMNIMWVSDRPQSIEYRPLELLLEKVFDFDIFHFHYGYSILPVNYQLIPSRSFPENLDLKLIKGMGKKIVFHHWSCWQGRHEDIWRKEWPVCEVCREQPYCYCKADYIKNLREREIEFADAQICAHPDLENMLPGKAHHLPLSIDLDLYDLKTFMKIKKQNREKYFDILNIPKEYIYKRKIPNSVLVYHSFNDRGGRGDVKGTKIIKETIKRLQEKGVAVELMYFDRVPNNEIKYYQYQAEIAIDQILFPWHGSTGLECMAAGVPLINWIDQNWKRDHHPDLPILNANMENLEDVISRLVKSKETRIELGEKCRKYVERTHSFEVVGTKLEEIYESLYI